MTTRVKTGIFLVIGLFALVGWSVLLAWISPGFDDPNSDAPKPLLEKPFWEFFVLQCLAGVIYLTTLAELRRHKSRWILLIVLGTGLLMRMAMFYSTPVMETDFYRYLWDGAVTANGENPYAFSPDEIKQFRGAGNNADIINSGSHDDPPPLPVIVPDELTGESARIQSPKGEDGDATKQPEKPAKRPPRRLIDLAEESDGVIDEVNHPLLRTIYPPTAQAAFAVAYWISPFDIDGLRWVWLALDFVVVAAVALVIRGKGNKMFGVAVYWLNPLLIKECYNSAHMELALMAPLMLALLAAMRSKRLISIVALAVAVAAKLWPVIWLPLLMRKLARDKRDLVVCLALFTVIASLFAIPVLVANLDANSGFSAYGKRWMMNDSVHMLIHTAWESQLQEPIARYASRATIGAIIAVALSILLWKYQSDDDWLPSSVTMLTCLLFLISPTQFPWYFVWALPLLAVRPWWSLLGLTVVLPCYYLRFLFVALDITSWFDYGIVFVEYVPIWLCLMIEIWLRRRKSVTAELSNADAETLNKGEG